MKVIHKMSIYRMSLFSLFSSSGAMYIHAIKVDKCVSNGVPWFLIVRLAFFAIVALPLRLSTDH